MDLPPIPRLNVDKIVGRARALADYFSHLQGRQVSPVLAASTGAVIARHCGYPDAHNCVQTMMQYVGETVTPELITMLSTQFAGREPDLASMPLVGYSRPERPEWIAMEVQTCQACTWRSSDPGVQFRLYCFNGHPAGHTVVRKFPEAFLHYFAYQVGWSRRTEFDGDARHFVGLRFWGYLVPVPDSDEVRFDDWGLTPAFKKHNRQLIALRTRYDVDEPKAECPRDYDHHCFECPVRKAECPATLNYLVCQTASSTSGT
jgi:hypothetical protein